MQRLWDPQTSIAGLTQDALIASRFSQEAMENPAFNTCVEQGLVLQCI